MELDNSIIRAMVLSVLFGTWSLLTMISQAELNARAPHKYNILMVKYTTLSMAYDKLNNELNERRVSVHTYSDMGTQTDAECTQRIIYNNDEKINTQLNVYYIEQNDDLNLHNLIIKSNAPPNIIDENTEKMGLSIDTISVFSTDEDGNNNEEDDISDEDESLQSTNTSMYNSQYVLESLIYRSSPPPKCIPRPPSTSTPYTLVKGIKFLLGGFGYI